MIATSTRRIALRAQVQLRAIEGTGQGARSSTPPTPILRSPLTGRARIGPKWMSDAEISSLLEAASKAQVGWAELPLEARAERMNRAAEILFEQRETLAELMAKEIGKPLSEGRAEIEKCAVVCRYYADNAERYLAPQLIESDALKSYVRPEPIGVIFAVMPWNYPFWQVFRFAAPNLMLGNGGVLKHADNVPGCALAIEQIFRDAGFPPDLFRTGFISIPQVKDVIESPKIAGVTLTGSRAAGSSVGAIAGGAIKPCVLELGGSDPFIVLPGADLRRAAEIGARSRCMNAGQTCIAAKRFIIHEDVYDEFMKHFVGEMSKYKAGDPFREDGSIGPLNAHRSRKRLHEQVQAIVKGGAKIALGGQLPRGTSAQYPPTILVDIRPDNPAATEELFGPVALVTRARSAEHAIELANDTPFGLGASIWTEDRDNAELLAAKIRAGSVFINGMVKSDPRLPFGGTKASGVGRELGGPGITAFANLKTVWIQ
jgi:succinate-semialdehyde dehydrogenase/glutarate-semialdehyde dehydrogenase